MQHRLVVDLDRRRYAGCKGHGSERDELRVCHCESQPGGQFAHKDGVRNREGGVRPLNLVHPFALRFRDPFQTGTRILPQGTQYFFCQRAVLLVFSFSAIFQLVFPITIYVRPDPQMTLLSLKLPAATAHWCEMVPLAARDRDSCRRYHGPGVVHNIVSFLRLTGTH